MAEPKDEDLRSIYAELGQSGSQTSQNTKAAEEAYSKAIQQAFAQIQSKPATKESGNE